MPLKSLRRYANAARKQVDTMRILAEGLSDIGQQRLSNEDSLTVDQNQHLFVVADGVGGQPAGEIASRVVTDQLPTLFAQLKQGDTFDARKVLAAAIQTCNQAVLETAAGKPEWHGMATTVVAAWCHGTELTFANVGDSRAYLLRDQAIEQLSEDHTVLAEQQRLGVAESQLSAQMAHVLTRGLGLAGEVEVSVDSLQVTIGDRILLCSDGLTDTLSEDVIRSVVMATRAPGEGCRMLVELANRNGGRDNITVVLIYLEEATLTSRISQLFTRRN